MSSCACVGVAVKMTEDNSLPPTSLTASVGQRVAIRCRTTVEGNVLWRYFNDSLTSHEQIVASDGRVLPGLANYFSLNSSGTRYHELIVKHSRLEDTGLYSCTEQSGIGDIHRSCLCITGKDDAIRTTNSCDDCCSGNVTICIVIPVVIFVLVLVVAAVIVIKRISTRTKKKPARNAFEDAGTLKAGSNVNTIPPGQISTQSSHTEPLLRTDSGTECRDAEIQDDGLKEYTDAIGHSVSKFYKTIVADADCNESCSRVFTIVGDNLYLVNVKQKKIQVYSIAENSVGERREVNDIELTEQELKKPYCFTASLDGKRLYLGDRESQVIFEVLLENKTTKIWVKVEKGEVQSLSAITDGLVVLNIERDIEDNFWHGRVFIYNSDGTFRTRITVPAQYFMPYCIKAIDDDLFAISHGAFEKSGMAIFSEQNNCVAAISGNKNLCIPRNFFYDRDERRFVIADSGTKLVLTVKLNDDNRMGHPQVLCSWATVGEFDHSVDAVRPVRVAYVSRTKHTRVIIALRSGRIDLHNLTT